MSGHAPAGMTGFDPVRAEGGGLADTARSLRTSIAPGLAGGVQLDRPHPLPDLHRRPPVFSLLLLVVMIQIIGGTASEEARTFVVLGSALWAMLVAGIAGPAWSVLEDRERYRMLKYLYVSPSTFLVLLVGRGGARLATGAMGTVVALVFAVIVLGLRVDLAAVNWPLLAAALVMGLVPIIALGVLLAAVCLQTRQESWSYPEAFAGCAVPDQRRGLPARRPALSRPGDRPREPPSPGGWPRSASRWSRTARRRSVAAGSLWTAVTGTAAPDATTVLCALFVTGSLVTLAAIAIFRSSERRARDLGLLDRTTGS